MRDNASPELLQIRRELARLEGSISRTLYGILRAAQGEGLVEKDVTPTLRDGRLVIPVAPGLKRKISGIVHDESALVERFISSLPRSWKPITRYENLRMRSEER